MSHAAYVHDIQHVVIDNLQFMVGTGNRSAFYAILLDFVHVDHTYLTRIFFVKIIQFYECIRLC